MNAEDVGEMITVNLLGLTVTISTADWGSYLSEPANIVAFIVASGVTTYNVVRIVHYLHQIKDRKK
jgi:hypothetical protein